MARAVQKLAVPLPQGIIFVPEDAEVIGVGEQFGTISLFVLGTVGGTVKQMQIYAFTTGTPIENDDLFHIGSMYVQAMATEYHFFVQTDQLFS